MPITALDDRTALIVIDLQQGTTSAPTAHAVDTIIGNAAQLAAAFRAAGLPVVLANVDGTPAGRTEYGAGAREFPAPWSDLVPALEPADGDILVTRRTWSAFAGTDLDTRLRALGVTQVVLAGIATTFGVESTARQAYDLGYDVALAVDAITDRSPDAHDDAVARVFPALGQLGATADVLALLAAR
ncbi:isochorismatase family cysteine hydrolase [Herbiconiux daphne]|uniref:Cysteine hydrolase n=1 Tax=Herbiconiux daphne TaxID=2970914 RepID=A0ABT2H7F5_9MICO|nr:isochorismatase family cysteine hydrolase [Herbiconiux daphne]MCS5735869.1 cysteine hydrolase [Herbiconiux daphne]